jgi:hypothetical protein
VKGQLRDDFLPNAIGFGVTPLAFVTQAEREMIFEGQA